MLKRMSTPDSFYLRGIVMQILRIPCCLFLLAAGLIVLSVPARARGAQDGTVNISVKLDSTLQLMRGGIGASWHAIEDSLPVVGEESHGGSAWGGNPPPGNEQAWQEIYRHAGWLGLDFCRVELEQRMYQPEKDRFDWDNREMRILYRILDWCQAQGVDVFLQQMWSNVDWNSYPEFRGDPVKRLHSAPLSLGEFAGGFAELVEHLVRKKGYSCIKWLSITNEPGHSWSWWQRPPTSPDPVTPALKAVREELDRRGIATPLAAPDWTDSPPLEPAKIDFDPFIGAYDIHSYYSRYDWTEKDDLPVDLPLSLVVKRLGDWADWAHERGKPFFLTELGSMVFGWQGRHNGPNTFEAALKDAELVVRGLNARVDGFNKWSFNNRGDLDGQWQMLDTWDPERGELLEKFTPKPNSYFVYGLVSRFSAKHSRTLATSVTGGELDSTSRVFAASLRSPGGELTLLVVNDAKSGWQAEYSLSGLKTKRSLYKYQVAFTQRDNAKLRIDPVGEYLLGPGQRVFSDKLPAFSMTVYTTYHLSHADSGIIAE